ncbi:porin [Zunongwangia sp. HGR-M22]|uniref:porin n=1 Tax=Zunongwangia sp. HGR-M22 TaxID=3015168 RepID=UPI0022DE01EB|nr:porin [Zunongwangia sp. HGR-M22]WBL24899.1 porin [Zunongwangia sp. HGR-M22]
MKCGFYSILSFLILFLGILNSDTVFSQSAEETSGDVLKDLQVNYGANGFEFRTNDNQYSLQIQSRLQFRYATPGDQDPLSFNDFDDNSGNVFKVNRSRIKVGGHAYKSWLKYYWEYDLGQSNLLDYRLMIEPWEFLNFKIGQFKVEYSRERRISSGAQQTVDRSILNRAFTVDRQQGIELYGRLRTVGAVDFNYWFGVFTGSGRGATENDNKDLMYFGRLQWNVFGENIGFTGSDLSIHEKPGAIIAVAGSTNRSQHTRFSSSGGGFFEGYESENPGQYRLNQANIETALVYQGFSWQSEIHWKKIEDRINLRATNLSGYYLQAGYLAHQSFSWWPKPLEIAARYASYTPNTRVKSNLDELTLALNWFFKGHRNKLTMEISEFDLETEDMGIKDELRFRIQWDISI